MPEYFYVYPAYLTKALSRADGRRVAESRALAEVGVDEIVRAARALGFRAEGEPEKHYPRRFFGYGGRVKVFKKDDVPKARFLREITDAIRRLPPPTETR